MAQYDSASESKILAIISYHGFGVQKWFSQGWLSTTISADTRELLLYSQGIEEQLWLNSDLPYLQVPESWYQRQLSVEGFTNVVFSRRNQTFISLSRSAITLNV
ncbi:hypothetical protein TNCV_2730251 [Trichonephila clavipes]|nr:hypothetical protein TNCV_2730251 [Trichonephila clavipes]